MRAAERRALEVGRFHSQLPSSTYCGQVVKDMEALEDILLGKGLIAWVARAMGVPREAFRYTRHPIDYDARRATSALARFGVACPPLPSYLDVLIRYFKAHGRDPGLRRGKLYEDAT